MDNLSVFLANHAKTQGDELAFTYIEDDGVISTLTFDNLHYTAKVVGNALLNNFSMGDKVVLLIPQGMDYIKAFIGCLYAGVVAVPLYPPKNNQHANRVHSVINDCNAQLILTVPTLKDYLSELYADICVMDIDSLLKLHNPTLDCKELPALPGNTLAFLQYTSGSTGTPKGVIVSQDNIIANLQSLVSATACDRKDVFCNWLPLFHDLGLVNTLLLPIYLGAHSVLMSPSRFIRRPALWFEAISQYRASICGAPNFAFDYCIEKIKIEKVIELDLSCWRVAFNAAEPINPDSLKMFAEKFVAVGFDEDAIYPSYGMAEATVFISGGNPKTPYDAISFDSESLQKRIAQEVPYCDTSQELIACGKAQQGHKVKIVDENSLQELQDGELGEIWFAGPSVAMGYWNDTHKTNSTFGLELKGDRSKYLRTGDLGFIHQGNIFVAGRIKDVMIVNGRNFYPQDFELQAFHAYPGTRLSGSVAIEVDGKCCLVAEVQRNKQNSFDFNKASNAIRSAIFEQFDVLLDDILFIRAGALNKTSSGKVQRAKTKTKYCSGEIEFLYSLKEHASNYSSDFAGPETDTERALCSIWEILLETKRISVNSDFLSLGGQSIIAARAVAMIRKEFDTELSVADLFEYSTIRRLANHLDLSIHTKAKGLPLLGELTEAPASSLQRSFWVSHCLKPSAVYNLCSTYHTAQEINADYLERAINALVTKHPALRTNLNQTLSGEVIQTVNAVDRFRLKVVKQVRDENELTKLIENEAESVFDLSNDLLIRVNLYRLEAKGNVIQITVHHVACDGLSQNILLTELSEIYDQMLAGKQVEPNPLEVFYTDFSTWQHGLAQNNKLENHKEFWRKQLLGAPEMHSLPLSYVRQLSADYQLQTYEQNLEHGLLELLKEVCKDSSCTLFMVLHALFVTLISRLSNESDVVVATAVANREFSELEDVVGCFVNTIVLRTDVSEADSFEQLLSITKQSLINVYQHQRYPFEVLVKELQAQRSPNITPLTQIMFLLEQEPKLTMGNQPLVAMETPEFSEFDLTLRVQEKQQGLTLKWQYNPSLFNKSAVKTMAHCFNVLSRALLNNPSQSLSHARLQDKHIDLRLWEQFNNTAVPFPDKMCIHQLFEEQVLIHPDNVAVRIGEQSISYKELNNKSNQLARYLKQEFVTGADSVIGVCLDRSLEMVVSLLAITKAGAAYLPLEPEYPADRISYMVNDAKVRVVISNAKLAANSTSLNANVIALDSTNVKAQLQKLSVENLALEEGCERNLAYVIYTSGSTGNPKGVMIEHQALVNRIHWMQSEYQLSSQDNVLQKTPFSFDVSVWEFFWTLGYGATLVVAKPGGHKDPFYLQSIINKENISVLHFVPSMLHSFLNTNARQTLQKMRYVFCSGEALPLDVLVKFKQNVINTELVNLYGPTEATIDVSHWSCQIQGQRRVPIGRPIQNIQLFVLDSNLNSLPIGVIGELYIAGVGLARGYLNQEELTSEKFINNPFYGQDGIKTSERMYRTGDIARWNEDGLLEYMGRVDHQVKIRGFRIEPGEIEHILKAYEGIDDVLVALRDTKSASKQLVAYVASESLLQDELQKIRRYVSSILPEHMVPTLFFLLPFFPLTSNGKLDRKALSAMDISHKFDETGLPITKIEKELVGIWEKVLGTKDIGINDNFFQRGGDSILAIRIIAEAKEIAVHFSLQDLIAHQSIRQLVSAKQLDFSPSTKMRKIEPFSLLSEAELQAIKGKVSAEGVVDSFPLSMLQQGMLFHSEQAGNYGMYHDVFTFKVNETWSEKVFRGNLQTLVENNEMLRSSIGFANKRHVHLIAGKINLPLNVIDLRELDNCQKKTSISQWVEAEKVAPIDLNGPLWSITIMLLEDNSFVYALSFHHALLDGWSVATLNTVLFRLYISELNGIDFQPQQALPYRYFIAQELESAESLDAISYWRGVANEAQVPWWTCKGKVSSIAKEFQLSSEQMNGVARLSSELNVSEKNILLTAYLSLLAMLNGQDNVTTTVVMHSRPPQLGSESTLGLFLNSLPFNMTLQNSSWYRLILKVNEQFFKATEYSAYPIAKIQLENGVDFSGALFNYVNFHVYNELQNDVNLSWYEGFEETNFTFQLDCIQRVENSKVSFVITLDADVFDQQDLNAFSDYFSNIVSDLLNNTQKEIHFNRFFSTQQFERLLQPYLPLTPEAEPT
ncbi:non-ribosomal peptide synthetase, partial [Pseudoalteromonas sp. MMG007]|uniref:non-ribosomal peptide synthetase n=1 Tax=Pseudoalteromonas sp. MMG007 TaxID=2822684 RepID=UPI001B358F5F